jgi:hypothetical protein
MDILNRIKQSYDFKDLEWIVENKRFTSNRGNKLIRIWKDKALLEWHIAWRDQVGKYQNFLVDRMIRTNENNAYIPIDEGFVTVHDDELEDYRRHFNVKVVGSFVGEMLKSNQQLDRNFSNMVQDNIFPFDLLIKNIEEDKLQEDEVKLITRALHEARKRVKLAKSLRNKAEGESPPITDAIESIKQCKSVFNTFYWRGGELYPQNAYSTLRSFFYSWKKRYDDDSLRELLDAIHNVYPIDQNQGYLMLAEIVTPWEIVHLLEKLEDLIDEQEKRSALESFKSEWENHRRLGTVVADWIDLSRKKVVQ